MTRSDSITELATALALAQGEIEGAKKDSENPHFRSKYADLASIWDACREPLSKHGLAIIQSPRLVSAGENLWICEVETMLLHKSGEFISDAIGIPVTRADAQGVGSAATYGKRYALASFVGVAPEDDDGEAAIGRTESRLAPAVRRPELGRVTVKVQGIVQRSVGKDNKTKYVITGDDRQTYQTFKKEIAESAKSAQEAGQAVDIAYSTSEYGRDITTLVEVQAAEQVPL